MSRNLLHELAASPLVQLTEKQKRLLASAIRLFAEKGYANTSTAEIAKDAMVSEASIFKQYGTKDKLLLSIIVPNIKGFFPSMLDEVIDQISIEHATMEELLTAFLKNRIQFAIENKEIAQVLMKEIIYNEELKKELVPYLAEVVTVRLRKIIELLKEHGELADIPTDRIMNMLFTFIGGFFASRFVLLNRDAIPDEEIEDAVRFMLHGIRKISLEKN